MKICILTTTHSPRDGRIFHREAKTLRKRHDITLIAPSEISDIYSSENIKIVAVKKSRSKIFHIFTLWRIFIAALSEKPDIYHCHEPDALAIGLTLKLFLRKRVVYDIHEHWPSEIPFDIGIGQKSLLNSVLTSYLSVIELLLARYSDKIIVVSESVGERFILQNPAIIPNYPIIDNNTYYEESTHDPNALMCVAGQMHAFHGITECIEAMIQLLPTNPQLVLFLIGNIREDLHEVLSRPEIKENVRICGFLPYNQLHKMLIEGGVGLLVFQPYYYNIKIGLPNKLFDYMLAGLPVIASNFPEIRKIVSDARCGLLIDPTDISAFADAIQYITGNPSIAKEMGDNGRRAVFSRYNWSTLENDLINVYHFNSV